MSDLSLSGRVVDQLRRLAPLYRFLRTTKRLTWRALPALFRVLGGNNPRIGAARQRVHLSDWVKAGKVEGRIILNSQPIPPTPAGSLRERTGWDLRQFSSWPVFWAHVPNARLVAGTQGLLLENKTIALESVWGEHHYQTDPAFNYCFLPAAQRLDGNWTSLVGKYASGFYHWFLDSLPRLACLDEFPPDTRILVRKSLTAYQRETLGMLGLTPDRIFEVTHPHLWVENYYFSSFTAMTGVSNPYAVTFLRNRFRPYFADEAAEPAKIFITRPGKTRGMRNEAAIAEYFRRVGWLVVDLEQLPLKAQIHLFSRAHAIVAGHGAALTNLLWSRPGTKVLEVCADRFVNGCYETLAELLSLDYRHILLPSDYAFRVNLPVKELERHRAWLNDGQKKSPVDRVLP